jgi:hypothetical protein
MLVKCFTNPRGGDALQKGAFSPWSADARDQMSTCVGLVRPCPDRVPHRKAGLRLAVKGEQADGLEPT